LSLLPVLYIFIKYWHAIKELLKDFAGFLYRFARKAYYLLKQFKINRHIKSSLHKCKEEPVLRVFKYIIPLKIRIDEKVGEVDIILKNGKVIAKIPPTDMKFVAEAIHGYFGTISASSRVKNCKELQKAIELYGFKKAISEIKLDGALEIAAESLIEKVLNRNDHVRNLFYLLDYVNHKLKEFKNPLEERLLVALLTEIYRSECGVNENLGLFV